MRGIKCLLFCLLFFSCSGLRSQTTLPDAPEPQKPKTWEQYKGHPAGFFTFRSWNDPPLRSSKQTLKSWQFWGAHAAAGAMIAVDLKTNPHTQENWSDSYIPLGALVGLDYLLDRYVCRCYAMAAPAYIVGYYMKDRVQ